MTKKNTYLLLTFLGVLLPYYLFLPWLLEHGYNLPFFFSELFANDVAGTGGLDILVVTIATIVFIIHEGKKLSISYFWLAAVGSAVVGVGFGLSLFLYMRERTIEKTGKYE